MLTVHIFPHTFQYFISFIVNGIEMDDDFDVYDDLDKFEKNEEAEKVKVS